MRHRKLNSLPKNNSAIGVYTEMIEAGHCLPLASGYT